MGSEGGAEVDFVLEFSEEAVSLSCELGLAAGVAGSLSLSAGVAGSSPVVDVDECW